MDDGWAEGLGAVQTGRQGSEQNTSPGQGDGRGGWGGTPQRAMRQNREMCRSEEGGKSDDTW